MPPPMPPSTPPAGAPPASAPLPSTAEPEPSSRRWWTLAVVALAQLMVVLDATVVNIALPSAQADLGFSNGDRQWVVTAYSLAFASLLLLGGRLSDLVGRKRMFIIGLVGFAAASALGGAAQSFDLLVAARALQGVFAALLAPTALAVLTTTFTIPRERARAFGVFGALAGAGGAIGLLLGGVLTEKLDWRWNLYINDVIAVVAVVGAVFLVPNLHRTGPRPKLDVPGTLLVSGALFGLVYGFSNAESDGWGSPGTWGFLGGAAILLVGFVLWQRRAAHPLLPLVILRDRNRTAAYASVLIAAVGMFGVFLFVTYYVQETLHYSPIRTGVSFLPMIVMLVLAAQLSTNVFVPRFGPKVMVPIGMALAVTAMVLFTRLDVDSAYAPTLLVPLMFMGAGMGTIMPASMQTATLGVDRQYAGVASALVNTSQQIGGSIGTALLNTLAATAATHYLASHGPVTAAVGAAATVQSYATAYWWCAGFFAFGGLLAAVVFRRRGHGLSLAHAHPAALQPLDAPVAEPVGA
ncbi:drug resistance transporter, EmrB/QacA subfamily [Friedmanniella luteola]|uniref:Drug resistance transporter, EmrB/QacA subfamily n=1 Tax=Friedmanniella luteola TaxID=546871 RepID=A0A1H1RUQ1_9ACTN|nr:MFS transporter [Friedmanniella luteola]SDS39246.1 drug resistance transporter, EmrB/QacA subfamily [Friedmanniella luteola]